jgi:ADP-ribose pyrophosphatase
VNIIPVRDGKIILTDQNQPGMESFISVPGGRIDKSESALEAARRELLEETGLVSDKIKLWFSYQPLNKIDWAVYNFIAYDCRKVGEQNLDNGEKIKLMRVTFDEFAKISAQDNFRNTEVSLKFFHALSNGGLNDLRKLFLE